MHVALKLYALFGPKRWVLYMSSYRIALNFHGSFTFTNFTNFSTICENISTKIFDMWRAVCACSKFASTKSSKITICENLHPRKFRTIRYICNLLRTVGACVLHPLHFDPAHHILKCNWKLKVRVW